MAKLKIFKYLNFFIFITYCFLSTISFTYATDRQECIGLYKEAFELKNKEKYGESITRFDNVIAKCPTFAQAYIMKAHILNMNAQYEQAIIVADEILKINGVKNERLRNSRALAVKSHALYNLHQFNKSLMCADLALSFEDNYILSLYIRAASNNALGNYRLAIVDFDKTLELDPNNNTNDETYLNRFCPLYNLKSYQEALETCDLALSITKNPISLRQIYSKKAAALNKLGRHKEALENANKALEISSNDPLGISEQKIAASRLNK
jgi:tetratricopeptide (TPR) repeat protein